MGPVRLSVPSQEIQSLISGPLHVLHEKWHDRQV